MIASRGPSAAISTTASDRSSSLANSWPTSSSASITLGRRHLFGPHGLAQRLAVGIHDGDDVRALEIAHQHGVDVRIHPRGSDPAKTTIAAPLAR